MAEQRTATAPGPSLEEVAAILGRHIPLYRWRRPAYQTALFRSLRRVWEPSHRTVLDVGGGTGIVAHAMRALLPIDRVASVDVSDRYLEGLDVESGVFDGETLPFADASFDCAVMCNVLHHVPVGARNALLMECGRVAKSGVIYIKDHLAESPLDHLRLAGLDLIGNLPFGGMVAATYLSRQQWLEVADEAGFSITAWEPDAYRSGPVRCLFPNRLEVLMKLKRRPAPKVQ
jgi:ubiquinone/menaquinone biosynthesis C-methylase UbiE